MRRLDAEDIKHIGNLIKYLEKSEIEKIKGPQILSTAFAFQWLGELKAAIEADLKAPVMSPVSSPISSPSPIEPASNKRKKK